MKVSVTLQQVMTYEITKEFDLTPTEYATYIKTGSLPIKKDIELTQELSSDIDDVNWETTENEIVNVDKI